MLLLSWWGAIVLSFLDSTVFFVIPFGNDALLIYLVARHPANFWLYPLLMTTGSFLGAWLTYWIGRKAGEKELPRLVSQRHIERMKRRVKDAGGVAFAITAALPPPFPLTPFVLTCGALEVDRTRFFVLFVLMRVIRFGVEAIFARIYGARVLDFLQSGIVEMIVIALVVVSVVATVFSGVMLWQRTRVPAARPA
jgi:membrane protein YqaA with SNARE-associated domain